MSRRRIAYGFAANLADRLAIAAVQLALVPVLAGHWGLALYGGWAILTTLPSLLALGDLGFINAATARMTMELARGEASAARLTMASTTQLLGWTGAAILLAAGGLAWLWPAAALPELPRTSPSAVRGAIALLALYAVLVLGCGLLQGAYRATGRFSLGTVLSTLTFVAENALVAAAAYAGYGLMTAAAALVIGRTAGLAGLAVVLARQRTGLMPALHGGSAAVRRQLLRPALAAMAIPLATALILQGTVAALGLIAGALAVPALVAARTLSRIGLQAAQMLTTPLMPEFSAATAKNHQAGVTRMFVAVALSSAAIAIPFAALLAYGGPWLVDLWSAHQIAAPRALMAAIALSALCGGIWNPLSNLMLAINRQSAFAPAYAVLAAVAVLLTLGLSPVLGSTAPALAMALVDAAMLLIVGHFAWRHWAAGNDLAGTTRALLREARAALRRPAD